MTEIDNIEPTVTATGADSAPVTENTTPDTGAEESASQDSTPAIDPTSAEEWDEDTARNAIRALAEDGSEESGAEDAGDEAGTETTETEEPKEEASDDPEGVTKIPGLDAELKKLTPNMAKRVESLFKEVPTLKAENARLAEQLETAQAAPVALSPTVADPLADIRSEDELEKALVYAQEVKRFAKRNPDGGTFQGREIDADKLEIMDDWADAALMQAPARRKYLEQYQNAAEFAKSVMPDVLNPKTQIGQALLTWVKQSPGVVQNPAYVGDFICMARGAAILQAERDGYKWVKVKAGEEKSPNAKKPARPATAQTSTVPLKSATGRPATDPTLRKRMESGDEDAIRQSMISMLG